MTPRGHFLIQLAMTTLMLVTPDLGLGAEADVLKVLVFDRPPLYETPANGTIGGFLVEISREVFREAGVQPVFQVVPPKRILKMIEDNQEPICSVGWFRTPERERWAHYTDAIYTDKPHVMIANAAKAATLPRRVSLEQAMRLLPKLALKDGFAYGEWIDRTIAAVRPDTQFTVGDNIQLLRMIKAGRADYTLISAEEAGWLLTRDKELASGLTVVNLADAPMGTSRHLMCSLSVPVALMTRLNRAIAEVKRRPIYERIIESITRPATP